MVLGCQISGRGEGRVKSVGEGGEELNQWGGGTNRGDPFCL